MSANSLSPRMFFLYTLDGIETMYDVVSTYITPQVQGWTRGAIVLGELNRSFKFGGRLDNLSYEHELTLSDIIPPPEFARAVSEVSLLDNIEDDSG